MAVSGALVGEIADPLIEKISEPMSRLVVGDGTDPASEMAADHREASERVAGFVDGAAGEGASVVVDGREQAFEGDGFFIGASLSTG